MATRATVPEIETRFVLSGLDDSIRQMSMFSSKVKAEFGSIEKAAAVNVKPLSGLGNALAGIGKIGTNASASWKRFGSSVTTSIKPINESVGKLGSSIVTVGKRLTVLGGSFKTVATAAKLSIGGISLAIGGLITSVTGAGVAVAKMSTNFADKIDDYGDKAAGIGLKPAELQALDYVSSQAGLPTENLTQGIANISTAAKQLFDGFNEADQKFADTLDTKTYEFEKAKTRNLKAIEVLNNSTSAEMIKAAEEEMKDSYEAAEKAREEFDEVRMQSYSASKDYLAQLYATDTSNYSDDQLHYLNVRIKQYEEAVAKIEKSSGSEGSAILSLQKYGLTLEEVAKGGRDALMEILRVYPKVTNAQEQLSIAMGLFGSRAGRRFVPVLQLGVEGIDEATEKIRGFGADITDADAKLADTWDATNHEFQLATDGIRKTIMNAVLPEIIKAVNQLNELISNNRELLASYFIAAFERMKVFSDDVLALFQGQRSGFKTPYLDFIVEKLSAAYEFAKNLAHEIGLAWNGESNLAWLNLLVGKLQEGGRLAEEFAKVMTGQGVAVEFPWLNDMPDKAAKLFDSLQKIVETLGGIITAAGNVFDILGSVFGVDPMTLGIGLGLLQMSGLLKTILLSFGLLGSVGKVGLGAAGSLIGAVGASTAGAGALTKLGPLAILAAAGYGGWKAGEWGGKELADLIYDPQIQKAADDARIVGDESYAKFGPKMNSRPDFDLWFQQRDNEAQLLQMYKPTANAFVPTETVNINLNGPDGQTAKLRASKKNADSTIGILTGALSGRTGSAF